MDRDHPAVLVSGCAGFVGAALCHALLDRHYTVVGIDNLNPYYSVALKTQRNERLLRRTGYAFLEGDVADQRFLAAVTRLHRFDSVFHLAAQVGVRDSLRNPQGYVRANVQGTANLLDAMLRMPTPPEFVLASTSSVYGLATHFPMREDDPADEAISPYGQSKRSAELLARSYARAGGGKVTVLRYFTVYGPWGRPDMAPFKFVERMLRHEAIEVFNGGDMVRDFTYVDDVIDATLALAEARRETDGASYEEFNVGASAPVRLLDFIGVLEDALHMKACVRKMPFQRGDVHTTHADISKMTRCTGYRPRVELQQGVARLVGWYRQWSGQPSHAR
jgi:UDP-glucuronate 4-epimerase